MRRAARAWRPHERFLMEDLSLAFLDLESHRTRGVRVDTICFNRMVATMARYFAYLGEKRTEGRLHALLQQYLDTHSVPESEQIGLEEFLGVEIDLPLLEELYEIEAEIGKSLPGNFGPASLMDVGLRLDDGLDASRYEHITPLNCRTFADTGGDGVHFSLLIRDGVINSDSPVVLTVPLSGNWIVGRTLFDFLSLGCLQGYDGLQEFAYDLEASLPSFMYSGRQPESADGSDEWEERSRRILEHLKNRLGLIPWTDPAHFHELQAEYAPVLRMPPE